MLLLFIFILVACFGIFTVFSYIMQFNTHSFFNSDDSFLALFFSAYIGVTILIICSMLSVICLKKTKIKTTC